MTPGDRERTRYYASRPRRVPPEFCTDELLEECSVLAALLLYRIISQADDQGRLPGAPKYIRVLCFGMRPEITVRKVESALTELVRAGFLIRYDYRGRVLLQVDRWQDLQGKWGRRAYTSRYPAPAGWTADWVNVKGDEPDLPEVRAPSARSAGSLHPPIPFSPPSSLSVPSTGPSTRRNAPARPERVGDLFDKARHGRLTSEEAFEFGSSLVDSDETRERA